jgi:hypothetical protein
VAITSPTDTACIQTGLSPDSFWRVEEDTKPSFCKNPLRYFCALKIAKRRKGTRRRDIVKRSTLYMKYIGAHEPVSVKINDPVKSENYPF